jgi:hypothetical protein
MSKITIPEVEREALGDSLLAIEAIARLIGKVDVNSIKVPDGTFYSALNVVIKEAGKLYDELVDVPNARNH